CSQDAARDPQGVDRSRGRLYRLRYGNTPRAPQFDLNAESDQQLIARLTSGNIYFRESAQRILTERLSAPGGDRSLQAALQDQVRNTEVPRPARMHALWALVGGTVLDPIFHEALLADSDPGIRAWGV